MKKFILLIMLVILIGCGGKNRTSVVDVLLEHQYTRTNNGMYELKTADGTYRIGNIEKNPSYASSLMNYYSKSAIVLIDNYPNVYTYHFTEDAVIFTTICGVDETSEPKRTEIMYLLKKDTAIIGIDTCSVVSESNEEADEVKLDEAFKSELIAKAELAKNTVKEMSLSAKDIQKLDE